MSGIGTFLQGVAAKEQGKFNEQAARQQATLFERSASQKFAIAQRAAQQQARETGILISRQRAVAASSGAGVYNPTVLDIIGDTAEQSAFKQAAITFQHESKARGMEQSAIFERQKGAFAKQAGQGAFAGSILSAVGQGAALLLEFGATALIQVAKVGQ